MGNYADVNGVHMYYESHGTGDPILLLHGGIGGAHSWQAQVPGLAERYHAFVPELRGRGRTADVDGAISYQSQAEDISAFLERIVLSPVHLVGASDGGVIGLFLAMQRPELLRSLVTIGTHFHHDGLMPGSNWTEAPASDETWAMPRQRYQAVSPDGAAHWPIVFAKLQRMWRDEPTLHVSDLRTVSIPVLVMAGDDDIVQHAHTIALYEALPLGQLAIVPAASHAVFLERPSLRQPTDPGVPRRDRAAQDLAADPSLSRHISAVPGSVADRLRAGERWQENGLVLATSIGTNSRRSDTWA